ncbi:hypothetical protein [Haladaptatus sp. DJG-WS-42]|uniref:hypothetical protein n=1 Tax=Haladaptatus sp. DJG-WS-42 TaxID=3120516 RepID=UPI0030D4422B
MGLGKLLNSPGAKRISTLSMIAEAAFAFRRGEPKIGAMLIGAALLSMRWSVVGLASEGLIRLYRRKRPLYAHQ